MFDRLSALAPSAELSNIRRTLDPAEQRAWADLRAGRSDRAMAHHQNRGQLHMTDTRDEAVEHAAQAWATLTETYDPSEVALISDASNQEINRLNARAQRGELGQREVPVPGVHYGVRRGDRIALIDQHYRPGAERIEKLRELAAATDTPPPHSPPGTYKQAWPRPPKTGRSGGYVRPPCSQARVAASTHLG